MRNAEERYMSGVVMLTYVNLNHGVILGGNFKLSLPIIGNVEIT